VKKDNASGSDEESGKKKPSRSVSRKRGNLFSFMRKEEAEEKKEGKAEKEEDKAATGEEAKSEEAAAVEPAAAEPAAGMSIP
jgi:hypothetical protein